MKDLKRRLCVSSISIAVVVLLLVFAYQSIFQYIAIGLVTLLTVVAVWEYEQFAKAKGGRMIFPALTAITVLEVVSFYAASQSQSLRLLPGVVFFLGFLVLFALHFKHREGVIVDLAVSAFGLLYIVVPMGMILGILYYSNDDGRLWVAYLLTVTKITDTGAYFFGSLWGRRKLAPNISPGKTVEGAVFGLVSALLASYIFHLVSTYQGSDFQLGTIEWVSLGVILGVMAPFSDLSESLLKRDANKKDSNALPGLGGVLDAIDSLLFTAPIIFFYLQYIKH
jgi:phosphatidate cytidylyltransferase